MFFNQDNDFIVADPAIGIVNLETKEVFHEYHIAKRQTEGLQSANLSWGTKLMQMREAKFFILPNSLLMPYSFLSVV